MRTRDTVVRLTRATIATRLVRVIPTPAAAARHEWDGRGGNRRGALRLRMTDSRQMRHDDDTTIRHFAVALVSAVVVRRVTIVETKRCATFRVVAVTRVSDTRRIFSSSRVAARTRPRISGARCLVALTAAPAATARIVVVVKKKKKQKKLYERGP